MAAMVEEMDMDELFDRHLEEHEGADTFEEDMGDAVPAQAADRHSQFEEVVGDDDASMEDLEEQYERAEYVPGSSLTPNNPSSFNAMKAPAPAPAPAPAADPFGFGNNSWGPSEGKGLKRVASQELPIGQSGGSGRPPSVGDFRIIRVIGKGSFGKVFLVRQHATGTIYAMKVLKKDNIVKRNQVEHTRTERSVLGYVRHPFIVGLCAAFQTADKLFFVLDYCAGGELFCHLQRRGKFAEPRARFYTAELVLALAHIHALGVVYRDLKPENVLLDDRGHVRLTDFGLSKEGVTAHAKGAHSFCGTPEYLAPEILARRGHGRAVDWWSLGALLYEMLTGLPPFYSRDREKLFEGIKHGDLSYPAHLGPDARAILRALLKRDPAERLGSGPTDADEIKAHAFFRGHIDWEALLDGTAAPPWQPTVVGSLDTSQFDREFTSLPIHSPPTRGGGAKPRADDQTFAGFSYDPRGQLHAAAGPKHSRR